MPQKKIGHGWSMSKAKRKLKRLPNPDEYQFPHTVRDWISICYKGQHLVKQSYHLPCACEGKICESQCFFWEKRGKQLKHHLAQLRRMNRDSVPSVDFFKNLFRTNYVLLKRNKNPDLCYSLIYNQKSENFPLHFM